MGMEDKYKKAFVIWFSVIIVGLILVSIVFVSKDSKEIEVTESSQVEQESLVDTESNSNSILESRDTETLALAESNLIYEETENNSVDEPKQNYKTDTNSETQAKVVIKDNKKEKAVLINMYNKIIENYDETYDFVFCGEDIGDDELGFNMGIKPDMYKTYFCKKSIDKFTSSIYLAVCAEDGKVEEVKKQLYKYKDKLTIEFESVPSEIERIQSADIIQHGDYVYFILLGKIDKTASAEQVRDQQKLNNKKAVEVVSNDLNYENVPEDIKEDKKFQMIYDVEYEINIPEIKSKPQNISSETEENITPEESEQAAIEETHEGNLSEETISN